MLAFLFALRFDGRRIHQLLPVAWLALSCAPAPAPAPTDWPAYGGDQGNSKFSAIEQVDRQTVDQLEVVWRWPSPDQEILTANPDLRTWAHEGTPVAIDGVLYTATSLSQIVALDGITGRTLWRHDPKSWQNGSPPNMGYVHRGVAYWDGSSSQSPLRSGPEQRVFIGTGDGFLLALDATTGEPIAEFGRASDGPQGRVDLTKNLRRLVDRGLYSVTSPPIVCRDVVIIGSSISDDPMPAEMPPGDVRGYDPWSGDLLWSFATVPQQGPARDTWENDSWQRIGNTNVWTLMSCDPELGFVYLPVSTPTNDYYGGDRLGDNLFAESLVALDATTGERQWHFQMVHHGLWDYDPPAAPNLIDVEIDGRTVAAVAQVTKQAFTFVFERATGRPLWPIEERPVPSSQVPGERTAPTQPHPTRPPAFDRQGVSESDLIDFTPELRAAAVDIFERFEHGPLYTPPSDLPTLVLPGPVGGASWAGAAADSNRGMLYVPSVTKASALMLIDGGVEAPGHPYRGRLRLNPPGPQGLPLFKPPWGRVTALDLNTGTISWTRTIGEGPRDHPALVDLELPPLGWPRRSFVMLTPSILFVAQQGKWRLGGMNEQGNAVLIENENHQPSLLALDPADGSLIAEIELPGNATGSPMTFQHLGRQLIVLPIGGGQLPAELIALALPELPVDSSAD